MILLNWFYKFDIDYWIDLLEYFIILIIYEKYLLLVIEYLLNNVNKFIEKGIIIFYCYIDEVC